MTIKIETIIYDNVQDIAARNELLVAHRRQAARIAELEAALELAIPSLLNLKAKVERSVGEPLPEDSRLLVAINTAERLLSKVQS